MGGLTIGILNYDSETFKPIGRDISDGIYFLRDMSCTVPDALKKHGCGKDHIFVDKASGAHSKRLGLDACPEELQQGDVLLVLRLDRLGRSMPHLVALVEQLRHQGIG